MTVVGMPLAMSYEVLETIGGEIKNHCGAWGGKEMATVWEFEHLRAKMQSTLKLMFY
jgi:hypothetical protein